MTDRTEPAIRASDGEREAVIARLNAAVGEGRLDIEEFSERVEVAYASRTRQELEPLTADLPATTDRTVVAAAPAGRPEHLTPIGSVKRSGAWRLERDSQLGVVAGTVKHGYVVQERCSMDVPGEVPDGAPTPDLHQQCTSQLLVTDDSGKTW